MSNRRVGHRAVFTCEHALILAAAIMILAGAWLRFQRLAYPPTLTFDEHHFVENARNYLRGASDWNDHPPLGKLLIALPMYLLGDTSFAWRLSPLLFGLALIAVSGLLARWVFRSSLAGVIAAALIATDGFCVAYSRTALLDGMLVTLCVAAVLIAATGRRHLSFALSVVLLGSACAVKFSALVFFLPVLILALRHRSVPVLTCLPSLLLGPLAYAGWFAFGLFLTNKLQHWSMVWSETTRLLEHHSHLTEWKNPLVSRWYTWFVPTKPIMMRWDALPDGRLRAMSCVGNIATWLGVDIALVAAVATTTRKLIRSRMRSLKADWRVEILLLCFALPFAPWILTNRDSYIYHYLLAYPFGVCVLSGLLSRIYVRRPMLALIVFLSIGLVAAYFAPIWGQLPIGSRALDDRILLKTWR